MSRLLSFALDGTIIDVILLSILAFSFSQKIYPAGELVKRVVFGVKLPSERA